MSVFGICIESSHKKGMGHFFRALNIIDFLKQRKENYILLVNSDINLASILRKKEIFFGTVNLNDLTSDWESKFIRKYKIDVWINDRLDTQIEHARNVKKNLTKLISLDDRGRGAEIADINFGSLPYNFNYSLKGIIVLKGLEYLVLDKKVSVFRRLRKKCEKVLVTLGGSDTYGVTVKVIKILKNNKIKATIVAGPSFKHWEELNKIADEDYGIINNVPSLTEEFSAYDLAITGGGITPFEANASGLPCIVIANELEEIDNGLFLESLGSSVFAGYHKDINEDVFLKKLNIEEMSNIGISKVKTCGVENIYRQITQL